MWALGSLILHGRVHHMSRGEMRRIQRRKAKRKKKEEDKKKQMQYKRLKGKEQSFLLCRMRVMCPSSGGEGKVCC